MKLSFENQGTNTYLVCALASGETLDSTCLGMIVNNRIAGLAPALYSQMDDQKFLKYNVSAKISATQLFEGVVNKKRLLGVFRGIVRAVLSAEDYMIDPSMLLLNLDYVFADVTTAETLVICLPLADERRPAVDFGQYFRDLVFHTRFDQTENCDYVARLINYLNGTPVFSLAEFSRLLEELSSDAPAAPAQAAPQPVRSAAPQPAVPAQPAAASAAPQPVQPAAQPRQPAPQAPQHPQQMQVPPAAAGKKQKPEKKKAAKQTAPAQPVPPRPEGEKEISMFTLLMHYSKENKELYKAQQAAKKAAKEAASAQSVPQPGQPAPAGAKAAPSSGFAVPGQSQTGLAVPGRPQPGFNVPGRPQQGFAVPGQPQQGFAAPAQSPAPAPAQPAPVQAAAPVQSRPVQSRPVQPAAPVPQVQPASFGETTVLGGSAGETTVLGAATPAAPVQPYLLRVKNNERIVLNKPSFRIGKERSFVDYFIADNTAISRSHANIINRDGEYFIVDTNSTNHTYVNGVMIRSNVETKLTHGTKITLANESFEFLTY